MARKNLFLANSSFELGTTSGFSALNGATISVDSDYAFVGTDSLKVAKSSGNNSGFASTIPVAVTAGLSYAVSIYLRLPVTVPIQEEADLNLIVEWRNASNAVIGTNTSATLTLTDDASWGRISGVWTAPAGAVSAYIRVTQVIAGTAGALFRADAILFEQASYVGGYIDNYTVAEVNSIANKALTLPTFQVFNGLVLNADVTINDLILNTIDEFGTLWVCTGIEGWWGHSTPTVPSIERGTEDGQYDVSGRYTARELTLTGSFWPANPDSALSAALDRLVTATNLVRKGGWLRTNESPTKASYVRLSSRPQIATTNARGRTDFSIPLRAADPIKYEWDDSDPDGLSHVHLNASSFTGIATNNGTADVTAVFMITGPIGSGSSIYNAETNETITLIESLRGSGPVGTINSLGVYQDVATITTTNNHHLLVGDIIEVAGAGAPFDSVGTQYVVTGASQVFPYTINFALTSDDITQTTGVGQVSLANNDVLIVDTYQRSVTYNGVSIGQRSKLATLTDWVKLAPGDNTLAFTDDVDHLTATYKQIVSGTATVTTSDTHYLIPGETVVVNFSTTKALSKKQLTSNVATLTTQVPHGYSVGDLITVSSTEISTVNTKAMTGGTATLTTVATNGISVSDTVLVALPATAVPNNKSLTSNVATLTTSVAHGFSAGDSVTVALPSTATVINKALTSNQATLTTNSAHNFQIGDNITVSLGGSATITNKAKSGASAIMTTSSAHGFSSGDTVVVALPTSATLTNTRSMAGSAGSYLATLNTSSAHNFSVGDQIVVNIGVTSSYTTTNRSATTTAATLTLSGTHGWSVGDSVTVSGVTGSRYNGTFYLTGVTSTTITYASAGTTESSTADTGGTVVNNTIATGYNGTHIIETIPSSTSLTFEVWAQDVATSSTTTGTSATLTNSTNTGFNGTKTLTSASGTSFAYNY